HLAGHDSFNAPFKLGLDALAFSLETQGGVDLSWDYNIDLGIGVNATDGFYVKLNKTAKPELNLNLTVELTPATTLRGSLFGLNVMATDNNGRTGFSGDLFVDFIDPNVTHKVDDQKLTWAQFTAPGKTFSDFVNAGLSTTAKIDLHLAA